MRFRSLSAAAALVLALTVVGAATARSSVTRVTTVKVTAKDFSFKLSTKTVKPGRVTFVDPQREPGAARLQDRRPPPRRRSGRTRPRSLTVNLKPGRYLFTCTVDSHAELGMKGYLRVQS